MDRAEIRAEVRRFLDDTVEPYEISDTAINSRIDEAINEACTRADLILDSSSSICDISVVAGTSEYATSPLIIDIHRARLPSAKKPLHKLGYKALDDEDGEWASRTGTPEAYILDMDTNKLVLYPTPKIDETLNMTVRRLPETGLADDDSEPEFAKTYHYDLIYWVLHLTYLTRDSEIFDQKASDRYESIFERRFGTRRTALQIERNKRSYRRRGKAQWL